VLAGRLVALVVLAFVASSCRERALGDMEASPSLAETQTPAPLPSARRPTRRHFLGRTQARCELYTVDGDQISEPIRTPCPPDLMPGERIRVAGRTCMREGSSSERREPVVCPGALNEQVRLDQESSQQK